MGMLSGFLEQVLQFWFSCSLLGAIVTIRGFCESIHAIPALSIQTKQRLSRKGASYIMKAFFLLQAHIKVLYNPESMRSGWQAVQKAVEAKKGSVIVVKHTYKLDGILFLTLAPSIVVESTHLCVDAELIAGDPGDLRRSSHLNCTAVTEFQIITQQARPHPMFKEILTGQIFSMVGCIPVHAIANEEGGSRIDEKQQANETKKVESILAHSGVVLSFLHPKTNKLTEEDHSPTWDTPVTLARLLHLNVWCLALHHSKVSWPAGAVLGGLPGRVSASLVKSKDATDCSLEIIDGEVRHLHEGIRIVSDEISAFRLQGAFYIISTCIYLRYGELALSASLCFLPAVVLTFREVFARRKRKKRRPGKRASHWVVFWIFFTCMTIIETNFLYLPSVFPGYGLAKMGIVLWLLYSRPFARLYDKRAGVSRKKRRERSIMNASEMLVSAFRG